MKEQLQKCLMQIRNHLEKELIPFWEERAIDPLYGGYLTDFDETGFAGMDTDKYIVTQTRMIWGFSCLYRTYKKPEYLEAAAQGVKFFLDHFWDKQYGGWYWKSNCRGEVVDDGKVVYGQTFAIYALSEYTLASGSPEGLEFADKTFRLLEKNCRDTENGGYFENMERDFSRSMPGFHGGDLKSLDIHMHMMEALSTLYECSGKKEHADALRDVIAVILDHMVNREAGCGYNQFTVDFTPKPSILIRRTWNAERETGETIEVPTDTTSYGHNAELVWLLNHAGRLLGQDEDTYDYICRKCIEHTLRYGYDAERGGIYRDGPHIGKALVRDKEWWQNCETLVGLLDAYEHFGNQSYLEAFMKIWSFADRYFINHEVGEWRQLLKKDGDVINGTLGNPWKGIYHTGRAMLECSKRLQRIITTL